MDSLQLLTLYLTLTQIFSGGKAKIKLHATPKLTEGLVMPINCLLRSFKFPSPQNDAITSRIVTYVICFQSIPTIESFLELTDCCLVYPTFFLQFVFAFFKHSIKLAQFLLAGVISFPFQAILTDDAFVTNVMLYPMT